MRWDWWVDSNGQKEKEDLDDISNELELADDEDMVPYVVATSWTLNERLADTTGPLPDRYKIGDSFISLPLPEVQDMLSASSTRIEEEVSVVAEKLGNVREEMSQLKVQLYARFGRSINLET